MFFWVNAIVGGFAERDNAANLAGARRMPEHDRYGLAIFDVLLPDGSGMDMLPILNAMQHIPVMVFSDRGMALENVREVKYAPVKSRTDNTQLPATIKRLIGVE